MVKANMTEKEIQDGEEEHLYSHILKMIQEVDFSQAEKRIEPNGMHIIETGEVLIINDEGKSISKLSKSDHFGMCDILRMVGPEYFGQMRAGLECV